MSSETRSLRLDSRGGRAECGGQLAAPPPRPRKGGRGAGPFHSSPNSPALFLPTQPLLPLKFKHPNLLPTPSLHLPPPFQKRRGQVRASNLNKTKFFGIPGFGIPEFGISEFCMPFRHTGIRHTAFRHT